jgi:hypothetical protein
MDKNYSYSINGCFDFTDCDSTKSLVCNLGTNCTCPIVSKQGMCDCARSLNNEYYWNGNKCLIASSPGGSCSNSSTNYMCQILTQGMICNNTSGSFKCECPYLKYYNNITNVCTNQLTINQTCSFDAQCLSVNGLICTGGFCK